ncbi:glycosyltransferase [Hominifimenecus sp. rT4P-3]|uniref:glycosyltransferase n=1 Tax=Hominifimenecus sp. rT4P-3 TaxID=3242979 RepID=UPI003DA2E45D
MREIRRILIVGLTSNPGGMETFIMNIYRRFDKTKYQFDFLTTDATMAFSEEAEELGGRIFFAPQKRKGVAAYRAYLETLFTENHFLAVCYQRCRRLTDLSVFAIAKAKGVPIRVLHSHSTKILNPSFSYRVLSALAFPRLSHYINYFFACSPDAGRWMFGNRPFTVIPNCIETERFTPNSERRKQIRNRLHAEGKVVLGTVGRLSDVKNPLYLLEIACELKKRAFPFVFWHVGEGELYSKMSELINERGLKQDFLLLGSQKDIPTYMDGMDLFLLPSLYEGFPMVLMEAQASGLPCLVSEAVTRDANLSGELHFLPLTDGVSTWADAIESTVVPSVRQGYAELLREKGYDLGRLVERMEAFLDQIEEEE